MKRWLFTWLWHAVVLLLVFGVGGLFVAVLGLIPIRASAGHWAVTANFLDFAKRRSVSTHTLGAAPLSLDEPWLVLKGAGHYETGCRPCHGAPDLREPVITRASTPRPPALRPKLGRWSSEELFYIVKHGIKFTGMPAWPALGRDDEVRALVAFLRRMPELDAAEYRRLVHGPSAAARDDTTHRAPLEDLAAPAPPAVATSCARCHGRAGEGRGNAAFPKLAGQRRTYLFNALEAYARGRRHSGIMEPLAAPFTRAEWDELARYYSSLTPSPPPKAAAESADVSAGREIALRGIRGQGVPSCVDCHGPGPGPRNEAYPLLAGQYADYLALQLELFRTQARGGSAYAHIMVNVASRLTPEQIRAVARFYESLPPAAPGDESP